MKILKMVNGWNNIFQFLQGKQKLAAPPPPLSPLFACKDIQEQQLFSHFYFILILKDILAFIVNVIIHYNQAHIRNQCQK
jgi:hypothetical protein